MNPYTVKTTIIEKGWNYTLVEILKDETKVGEYTRNYGSFGEETFCPVKRGDDWYALYSPRYQEICVMTLPDCKDITVRTDEDGKRIKDGFGFCPVEIWVPHYRKLSWMTTRTKKWVTEKVNEREICSRKDCEPYEEEDCWMYFEEPTQEKLMVWKDKNGTLSDWIWCDFGFVAGCVWADDSSWKIQRLDLKNIAKGIVINEAKFGYIELPDDMNLKDAISTSQWLDGENWFDRVTITHKTCFDQETGEAF